MHSFILHFVALCTSEIHSCVKLWSRSAWRWTTEWKRIVYGNHYVLLESRLFFSYRKNKLHLKIFGAVIKRYQTYYIHSLWVISIKICLIEKTIESPWTWKFHYSAWRYIFKPFSWINILFINFTFFGMFGILLLFKRVLEEVGG